MLFSRVVAPACIPTNSVGGIPSLRILASNVIPRLVNFSHSDWCEVLSHCGFDLYFPDAE